MEHLLKNIDKPETDEKQAPAHGIKARRLILASAINFLKLYLYIYRIINIIYQI